MTKIIGSLICLLAFVLVLPGFADDQEKAVNEIKKISAFSVDSNMRSVVNRTMADMLKAKRLDLVKQRQDMNLSYGNLFLARELEAGGLKMEQIAQELKAGKSMLDIANGHANWKQIDSDAKKLNHKIDDNVEKYLQNPKKAQAQDESDDYDAKADKVAADSDVSKDEYADAQKRYQRLTEMAGSHLPTGDANAKNQGQGGDAPVVPPPTSRH
ncbi:MAG TPA: hypothetical protein VEI52_17975 [Terriglobales bacterium]|nr:hypothetical protein [Terriglobales bacterium]